MNDNRRFSAVNGNAVIVKGLYEVPIIINKREYYHPIFIVQNLATELLLGADFINAIGLIINGETRKVILKGKVISENFGHPYDQLDQLTEIRYQYGRSTKKHELPGHSICYVEVDAPPDPDAEYMTTDVDFGRPDLVVYNTITRPNEQGKCHAIIGNVSQEHDCVGHANQIGKPRKG